MSEDEGAGSYGRRVDAIENLRAYFYHVVVRVSSHRLLRVEPELIG